MDSFNRQSFFKDIQSRELGGFRVRKRPYYMANDSQDPSSIGAVAVEHDGDPSPPMAVSFCKTYKNGHILALTDEGGYIGLYNTRHKFSDSSNYRGNAEKAKVSEWVAHDNAIFDICWIKKKIWFIDDSENGFHWDHFILVKAKLWVYANILQEDTRLLTASGDQSIKVWDIQEMKCIRALMGHTGSVKSISSHPTNQDLAVSGSRDGSFALWDTRCSDTYHKLCISPISTIHEAHLSVGPRRSGRWKAKSMSITSVLYLKDEVSIATAGAVDSVIKFWDTRQLIGPVTQAFPSGAKGKRLHGISSLSQDSNGVFITASCMDHRIYMYNVLQLERGDIKTFSGGRTESFFVKSAISPDASYILSGASDGNAYIWQVSKPEQDPMTLKSHDGEVTAVDWCPSEIGKVATCSDDFTVRFWNIQSCCYSNTRSPSLIRKRVMALPRMERRKLFADETLSTKSDTENRPSNVVSHTNSPGSGRMHEVGTPESQEKNISFNSLVQENLDKTPEAEMKSPSSVLNPLSSLKKKTIRDYFQVS